MTTHDLANWRERSSTVREYLKDIESALYQADDEKFELRTAASHLLAVLPAIGLDSEAMEAARELARIVRYPGY